MIKKVEARVPKPLYTLSDTQGDPVKGRFYRQQLRPAPDPEEFPYEIEKILDHRTLPNGKKQILGNHLEKKLVAF